MTSTLERQMTASSLKNDAAKMRSFGDDAPTPRGHTWDDFADLYDWIAENIASPATCCNQEMRRRVSSFHCDRCFAVKSHPKFPVLERSS